MKRKGFSGFRLIELVVFVAIAAITLAGILLPTLANAVKDEKSVTCMNNLKQMGQATLAYALDNDGWLPPESSSFAGVPNAYVAVIPYLAPELKRVNLGAANWSLWKNKYCCPAGAENLPYRGNTYRTYAYNSILGQLDEKGQPPTWGKNWHPYRVDMVVYPEKKLLWGDCVDPDRGLRGSKMKQDINNPHNGGANYVFVDGHVAWHAKGSLTEADNLNPLSF